MSDTLIDSLSARARDEIARRQRMSAMKAEAEDDLVAFISMMWHAVEPVAPFVPGWPIEALADALMAVTDGHIKRLLVNIFPGSMKSLMLNVFWPAWEWGPRNMPSTRYISTSYSSSLTERDNGRLLRVLQDPIYRRCWGDRVQMTKEGVGLMENSATGWKMATSIGGKMTGFRGDRVMIDDGNNPADVESPDVRASTTQWVREVMPDRLQRMDAGAIISVQQRTHEEDVTGVLAQHGVGYTWMMIPMEYDPLRASPVVLRRDESGEPVDVWADPRGLDADGNELAGLYTDAKGNLALRPGSPMAHAEGTLAWPARFPEHVVDAMKSEKGAYAYAGQYQQSPTARGGGIVRRDWWQTWNSPAFPDFGTVVASLDTALEENTDADWNALTGWGAFPNDSGAPQLMLRFGERKRCKLAELVKWTYDECIRIKADYLLIEHKTRGRDVHDEILRLYANAPFQTVLVKPSGDKVSRLNAVTHLFSGDLRRDPVSGLDVYENGMVWAPDTAWAEEVINEVSVFPRGANDDYVDTVSQALLWIRKNGVVLRKVEHDADEEAQRQFKRAPKVPYTV
jgi:phage terminase large subunit-like protein